MTTSAVLSKLGVSDPSVATDLLFIETDRFNGPLDLLLHLVRIQDIDIFDIPIARITGQFLAAIEQLEEKGLDEAGEFLEMAASLVHIKAGMLLPKPADDEDFDPRAELVSRLMEYELVREIASRLRIAENDRCHRFGKGYFPPRPKPRVADAPLDVTWEAVFKAALRTDPPKEPRRHRMTPRSVALKDKVKLIVGTMRKVRRIEFSKLVAPWKQRTHGVMTLLAGLELGRRRIVSLKQRKPFSPLWIYRGENLNGNGLERESRSRKQGSPGLQAPRGIE